MEPGASIRAVGSGVSAVSCARTGYANRRAQVTREPLSIRPVTRLC